MAHGVQFSLADRGAACWEGTNATFFADAYLDELSQSVAVILRALRALVLQRSERFVPGVPSGFLDSTSSEITIAQRSQADRSSARK